MGAGASTAAAATLDSDASFESTAAIEVVLKRLPDAIEEAVFVREKFPLIIDPTEQAARFLKYQTGAYLNFDDPRQGTKESIHTALVSSFLHGRTFTLRLPTLQGISADDFFADGLFPREALDKAAFSREEVWRSVLTAEKLKEVSSGSCSDSNVSLEDAALSPEYVFILCTATEYVPPELQHIMQVIKVTDKVSNNNNSSSSGSGSCSDSSSGEGGEDMMEQIAAMFGAKEVVRNSTALVEAAFDGNLDELKAQIDKGYHIESTDGRKHSALSEAACQGHLHVVQFLLQQGADPNSLSDTGRSALWRACFNGHTAVARLLLESGADAEVTDRVSMESAADVAQHAADESLQQLLLSWDPRTTQQLLQERKRVILASLEARIKTAAEREALARNLIRQELVMKAQSGDAEGVRELLEVIASEAQQCGGRPRATAEARSSETGQSLLSLAAQNDCEELALLLLTHWRRIDEHRFDLAEGEVSDEAKIFKANPNSRDLKGWTCACIAVFHDSRKVLKLLLEHGANPNIRSSYNKNAWDLAKDELDAAERVVKSKAEIRQVLIDYSSNSGAGGVIFGSGGVLVNDAAGTQRALYKDLGDEGSPVVMNIELNAEAATAMTAVAAGQKSKNGGKSSGKAAKSGGSSGNSSGVGNNKSTKAGGAGGKSSSSNAAAKTSGGTIGKAKSKK